MIEELKGYYWGSGDAPRKVDDHALDEMRYYLMTRPKKLPAKAEKSVIQKDKEALLRHRKKGRFYDG